MEFMTDETASTHLGKKTEGSSEYDPSLLVAIPRIENRINCGIETEHLPFYGFDIWHAYEFSALTKNGLPVTRIMKLKYNCDNDFIVESKSLKLYLNSFNMTRLGNNINECLDVCKQTIEKDLSKCLKTKVCVNFMDNKAKRIEIFKNYKNILDYIDEKSIQIEHFKETPELLKCDITGRARKHYLSFESLRSNCRVTHQPDFGDIFIYYNSSKHIDEISLVKYLVSFRCEYHFHEECCEMIYKRLYDLLGEDGEIMVCTLYTRRGGIDICPIRSSKNCSLEDIYKISDITKFARGGIKQ